MECADAIGDAALQSQARAIWVGLSFVNGSGVDADALTEALRLQGSTRATHVNMRADAIKALTDSWTGDLGAAMTQLDAIRADCAERGSELDTIWIEQHMLMNCIWSADYARASRIAHDMAQRAEQIGGHQTVHFALTGRAFAAAYTGDVDTARRSAVAAAELAEQAGGRHLAVAPRTCLAFLDVSLGDHPAALHTLAPLIDEFDPRYGTEITTGGWIPDAVEALAGVGRLDDADRLLDSLQDNGVRLQRPWMLAMAARGRALVAAARGDLEGAEAYAREALAQHDRMQMPFEAARTRLVLGQLERRQRRRQAAIATVAAASAVFDQVGAALWRERARAELARLTGGKTDESGLTPAETRIARLRGGGHVQQGDRRRVVRVRQDHRDDPHQRLPQTRHPFTRATAFAVAADAREIPDSRRRLRAIASATWSAPTRCSGAFSQSGINPCCRSAASTTSPTPSPQPAQQLRGSGHPVRLLAAVAAASDQVLYGVFAADSSETVTRTCDLAGWPADRIIGGVEAHIAAHP